MCRKGFGNGSWGAFTMFLCSLSALQPYSPISVHAFTIPSTHSTSRVNSMTSMKNYDHRHNKNINFGTSWVLVVRQMDTDSIISPATTISARLQTLLSMGRAGGGGSRRGGTTNNRSNRNKKNKSRNFEGGGASTSKKNKKRNTGSANERDIARASTKSNVILPSSSSSTSSHSPPWQIMSNKDVKRNIENELERRENIKQGLISSSDQSTADTNHSNNTKQRKKADVTASNHLLSPTDRSLLSWKRFNAESAPGGVAYIGSYLGKRLPPSLGVPEVAFLGRSNVGKSSLLNQLCTKTNASASASDTARVGKTPGATASVNLYALLAKSKKKNMPITKGADITSSFSLASSKPILGLADLPGFGYAKLSKQVKESVEVAAERYLGKRRELALGILLVDVRRIPSDDDRAVLAALYDMGVPLLVVATKVDKLSYNALPLALEEVRVGLGLPEGQPLCVSSVTGEGTKALWRIIIDACEDKVAELREEVETGGRGRKDDKEDEDEYGTIKLDDQGNLIEEEELEYDQGYDWVQNYGSVMYEEDGSDYYGRKNDSIDDNDDNFVDAYDEDNEDWMEDSRRRMRENEEMQAVAKESMRLKNLKRTVRSMERKGRV